jgi:hypothetical protein
MPKGTLINFAFISALLSAATWVAGQQTTIRPASDMTSGIVWIEGKGVKCGIDRATGLPSKFNTKVGQAGVAWLSGPAHLQVRNEATNVTAAISTPKVEAAPGGVKVVGSITALMLEITQEWRSGNSGVTWDLTFAGSGKRAGHEIILELPVLSPASQVFTPSERGLIDVGRSRDYQAIPYGHPGVYTNRAYVLPLVSVFNAKQDSALTIALPADANIPDFEVSWKDAKTLRLEFGHRAMGGNQPSALRLLFYTHPADYRSVLKAYSDDFPAYFQPALPRGPFEASFYYHHIQDHPDFEEMARQNVRYLWSSFWFTHVGEYLPAETEWYPYTASNWWNLGEKISDEKINHFIKEMNDHGVAVFAYFNVDEYGGEGIYNGVEQHGDSPVIEQDRRERFANALVQDSSGKEIVSWRGTKVMNPDPRYSYYPYLMEQVRRHLTRLPGIYGFIIDRMDWGSRIDFAHDDGFTMVGSHPAENLAMPIAAAVNEICRLSHAQGKRVFTNQFYRIEGLRDVDGVCHENDYLPALAYLTPLRPAAAWNYRQPYHGDLLLFEAQLKRRLQFALFPQMIAHQFPISQQEPDARAADLLEIYAPLFATLVGKQQVLLPHCVAVSGANDANLFRNGEGNYVAPVTSRTRFLSRRVAASESATLRLRVPDAVELKWAHVYSADAPPYRARVTFTGEGLQVDVRQHGTASMVVIGKAPEPPLSEGDSARIAQLRDQLFGLAAQPAHAIPGAPTDVEVQGAFITIEGTQAGQWGSVGVLVNGERQGEISSGQGTFPLSTPLGENPPTVTLTLPDQGMWFVPQHLELVAQAVNGKNYRLAEWTPGDDARAGNFSGDLELRMRWCKAEVLK